jgi:hypothetical protein
LRISRRDEDGGRRDEGALPKCSDPDDQKFLELALACGATALLTRDEALLSLGRKKSRPLPFRIITPRALRQDRAGACILSRIHSNTPPERRGGA